MKRMLLFVMAAALCARPGVFAQGTDEPSADAVLQKARDLLAAAVTAAAPTDSAGYIDPVEPDDVDTATDREYLPFTVGFVPGLSFPFGLYDTSLSLAAVGALTGAVDGFQGAGVFNIALGRVAGLQGAGVFNVVEGGVDGFQGAGVFNIASGDVNGFQGAGVFNIAEGEVSIFQGAGIFNIAGSIEGVQAAGIFNAADHLDGLMLSGIVNVAGEASGAMVGLVNVADSLDGVAIGLVNIIGNGIHDVAAEYQFASDSVYATYRSGTPFLYGVFYAGQPAAEALRSYEWVTLGAGLGHRFHVLFLTADVELAAEAPMDAAALAGLVDAIDGTWSPGGYGWPGAFGSVRASFGLGARKGFGIYAGIKADFGISGWGSVPERLRRSSFGNGSYAFNLFGKTVDLWPKWFIGVKM